MCTKIPMQKSEKNTKKLKNALYRREKKWYDNMNI